MSKAEGMFILGLVVGVILGIRHAEIHHAVRAARYSPPIDAGEIQGPQVDAGEMQGQWKQAGLMVNQNPTTNQELTANQKAVYPDALADLKGKPGKVIPDPDDNDCLDTVDASGKQVSFHCAM